MTIRSRALAALTVFVVLAVAASAAQATAARTDATRASVKLPRDYKAWTRVAGCESGGWKILGSLYPDSLGIDRSNYIHYGGRPQAATSNVSLAKRVAQIRIADRLIRRIHIRIPDQHGCAAW